MQNQARTETIHVVEDDQLHAQVFTINFMQTVPRAKLFSADSSKCMGISNKGNQF